MLINSTRASCPSSPPWRLSTPLPRLAATGEAPATKGTPRTLEGLNPLTRKSCSLAGKKRKTTAPSPPCSDSPMAPAARSRVTPTVGRGQRPQFNLFPSGVLFLYSDIRYSGSNFEMNLVVTHWELELNKRYRNLFIEELSWDCVANQISVIQLWGITMKVTFKTVPKSAAKSCTEHYGTALERSPSSVLARCLNVQRAQCNKVTKTHEDQRLWVLKPHCVTLKIRALALLCLPAFYSWQQKCTSLQLFRILWLFQQVVTLLMTMMKTVTVLKCFDQICSLLYSYHPCLSFFSTCLFCLFLGQTGVACVQTYYLETLPRTLGQTLQHCKEGCDRIVKLSVGQVDQSWSVLCLKIK